MNEKTGNMDFGAVWRRVFGEGEAPGDPAAQGQLAAFLAAENQHAQALSALSGRTQGPARAQLLALARGARDRAKKLETELFLFSGSCPPPDKGAALPPSFPEALRRLYLQAESRAAEYEKAAALSLDGRRADLFRALAAGCKKQAAAIAALLDAFLHKGPQA